MPVFIVEHTETLEFTVEAKDREELEKALEAMSDYDWKDFAGWDENDAVYLARKDVKVADCGVVGESIVDWRDYQADLARRGEQEQEPVDTRTLPLPGIA